jgi:NAD(P)H-dependent FMN reductase
VTRILGISGSLRRGSFNTSLLRTAAELMPAGSELVIASIENIPLYNGDVELQGIPQAVSDLKKQIIDAKGLLFATPEYNNSVPGVLKNTIDWLTRPATDIKIVFAGRPVAIMGASPGGFGTILSQNAWLPILRTLQTRTWFGGRMMVSRAATIFDANGVLTDEAVKKQLQQFVQGFVQFVNEH